MSKSGIVDNTSRQVDSNIINIFYRTIILLHHLQQCIRDWILFKLIPHLQFVAYLEIKLFYWS